MIRVLGKPEVVKTVDHIEITKEPNKTTYNAGDKFDPTGMVVTAVYKEDGTTAVLSRDQYVIFSGNNDDKLREGQTYVTIQYNDGSGNSDIKVRQSIIVGPYVGDHQHTYDDSPWYQDATHMRGPTPIPTMIRGIRTRRATGIGAPTRTARLRAAAQRTWRPIPSCGR